MVYSKRAINHLVSRGAVMGPTENSMKLVTVQEMRQIEQSADASGHPYAAMMEAAGQAVADAIKLRVTVKNKRILTLIGPGNNGGDGLVAARHLSQAGAQIICYLWKPRAYGDPNLTLVREHKVHCLESTGDGNGKTLYNALQDADVIIDALLGTGVTRPISGDLRELLKTVQQVVLDRRSPVSTGLARLVPGPRVPNCPSPPSPFVVAVDVPSGMDCDTGEVDPVTLPADLTITFGAAKRGQFCASAAVVLGELLVADIGIDPALTREIATEVASPLLVGTHLPERPLDAHKGTFGKTMIVAGSTNYTGAPYLAAAAAARVGTGLVTLACPPPIYPILATKLSEATFLLLPHDMGVLTSQATQVLVPKLAGYTALLLGPGLGREEETTAFVHRLLGISQGSRPKRMGFQRASGQPTDRVRLPPLVIDADGLNALSETQDWWTCVPQNSILTPHAGEMARLAGLEPETVNADRMAVAGRHASQWGQVIVLKGAFTVVAAPDGRTTVIPFANPGLATAGTGDVLAGAIAGMLAQGLDPFHAAICGAYLHGLAGAMVAERLGGAGMLAGDLLPVLPQAMARLRT